MEEYRAVLVGVQVGDGERLGESHDWKYDLGHSGGETYKGKQ